MKAFMIEDESAVSYKLLGVGERYSDGARTYKVAFKCGNSNVTMISEDNEIMVVLSTSGTGHIAVSSFTCFGTHGATTQQHHWNNIKLDGGCLVGPKKTKAWRPVKAGDVLINNMGDERKVQFVCEDNALVLISDASYIVNPGRKDADLIFKNVTVKEV